MPNLKAKPYWHCVVECSHENDCGLHGCRIVILSNLLPFNIQIVYILLQFPPSSAAEVHWHTSLRKESTGEFPFMQQEMLRVPWAKGAS
jgi:hypothetical protein